VPRLIGWGMQIGGIQAASPDDAAARDVAPLDELLDHGERVAEFGRRHGGLLPHGRRTESLEGGYVGWSEVHAADGYVLRIEWSRSELRSTLQVFELAPRSS
jgi:hypothetical protein